MKTIIGALALFFAVVFNAQGEDASGSSNVSQGLTGLLDQAKSKLKEMNTHSAANTNQVGNSGTPPTVNSVRNSDLYSYDVAGVKLGMSEQEAKRAIAATIKGAQFKDINYKLSDGSMVRGGIHGFTGKSYAGEMSYHNSVAVYLAEGKVWGVTRSVVVRKDGENNKPIAYDKFIDAVKAKYPQVAVTPLTKDGRLKSYDIVHYTINANGAVNTDEHCNYPGDDWGSGASAPMSVTVFQSCPGILKIKGNLFQEQGITTVAGYIVYLIDGGIGYNWTNQTMQAGVTARKKQILEGGKADF
jgi:hypothetical protein